MWLEARPENFVHTVLDGIDGSDGLPGAMPAFRDKLNDPELTAIIEFVRTFRTNAPGWPELTKDVAKIRRKSVSEP